MSTKPSAQREQTQYRCTYAWLTGIQSVDSESQARHGQEVLVARNCTSSLGPPTRHMFTVDFCSSLGASSPPKAMLLHPKLSQIGLGFAIATVLLAIVIPGVLVGVVLGQAELGITLSAAIAGTFALAGNLRG